MVKETQDRSVGIVPVIKGEPNRYILVQHENGEHWVFPKGHVEEGETDKEAAVRELKEETGMVLSESKLEATTLEERYTFKQEDAVVQKQVMYYVAFVEEGDIHIPPNEIKDCRKVTFDEALELITFKESKHILRQVDDYLKTTN